MPQAIERLLATPNTTPRLPAINLAASAIDPPALENDGALYARGPGPEGFSALDRLNWAGRLSIPAPLWRMPTL